MCAPIGERQGVVSLPQCGCMCVNAYVELCVYQENYMRAAMVCALFSLVLHASLMSPSSFPAASLYPSLSSLPY